MKLGMQVGLGSGHIALDGDPAPPPPKGHSPPPQFSAHDRCGQTVGWNKMPLGKEIGLGPGDFVLDADPPPSPKKEAESPNFRRISTLAKRLDGPRWHLA